MTHSPLHFLLLSSAESVDESLNPVTEELPDHCLPVVKIRHLEVLLE